MSTYTDATSSPTLISLRASIDRLLRHLHPHLPPLSIPSPTALLTLLDHQSHVHPLALLDICSPTLALRFREYLATLPESDRGVQVAFHGTLSTRVNSILVDGLLLPGEVNSKRRKVKHVTDDGWYGKGIYLSPEMGQAELYAGPYDLAPDTQDRQAQDGAVFVCLVARGRVYYARDGELVGKGCKKSYHSHEHDNGGGGAEDWVMFNKAAVLPVFVTTAGEKNEMDDGSRRVRKKLQAERQKFVEMFDEGMDEVVQQAQELEQRLQGEEAKRVKRKREMQYPRRSKREKGVL